LNCDRPNLLFALKLKKISAELGKVTLLVVQIALNQQLAKEMRTRNEPGISRNELGIPRKKTGTSPEHPGTKAEPPGTIRKSEGPAEIKNMPIK
jgi:hypothetical protein